jgi:hypothetical protein
LTCHVVVDSGLDEDHADKQKTREDKQYVPLALAAGHHTHIYASRYEAYDRVEGQAQLAEKVAALGDDGEISKSDQKQIDAEKKHQLQMRHRGVMQFAPVRSAAWTKQGIKQRASRFKAKLTGSDSTREQTVEGEA